MTPYQLHCERWSEGCGSGLCQRKNTRIVLGKGKLPCDVLFVGEAPGESENVLGRPFAGPAGKLLDHMIARAGMWELRLAFTNVVACIPREEDGSKAAEPLENEVLDCQPRLEEWIKLANPRLIVCVGKLAADWLEQGYKTSVRLPRKGIPMVKIDHPARILRSNEANQGLMIQRCVVTLANALEELQAPEGGTR